jgi:hypothetical protein
VEIFGTFECPCYWNNETDFDRILDLCNRRFIEICETYYEEHAEEEEPTEEDKNNYIAEQLIEVYHIYGIEENDMLFSNVECNNELFYDYYKHENTFPNCWILSTDEFEFIEMPVPDFKNACGCH